MVELTLGILGLGTCKIDGCFRRAGLFGVCGQHQDEEINRYFRKAAAQNQCDTHKPQCFDSDPQWREYAVAVVLSNRGGIDKVRRPVVSYCRDCTPQYKQQMMAEGRCSHHETVFVRSEKHGNDVIGVALETNRKSTIGWESAIMGVIGEVVTMPPAEVIDDKLTYLAEVRKPKKRGPRFKKDRV